MLLHAPRYLGGWPASPSMMPQGSPAILDCTCELPRMQRQLPYLNLPVWDTHGTCRTPASSSVVTVLNATSAMQMRLHS